MCEWWFEWCGIVYGVLDVSVVTCSSCVSSICLPTSLYTLCCRERQEAV